MPETKKKSKTIAFITPFGTLRYPKITQPDTKGEYADGKHKTDIVFGDAEQATFEKKLREVAKQLIPDGVDISKVKLPLYTEWEEGKGSRAKSKYRPLVIKMTKDEDGEWNEYPETTKIGGGTVARLAVAAGYYKKGADKGINLYLNKVQIKELVEYGSADAEFDDEGCEGTEASDDTSSGEDFDSL